jgi:hypothetical protein
MTRAHVAVARCHRTANGQVTVLSVHVVGARPRVVAQPDAKVLDLQRCLLEHTLDGHNFAGGLLEFAQLTQEIPETGLGNDLVGRKDVHFEEGRRWLLFGGQFTANHLVFV